MPASKVRRRAMYQTSVRDIAPGPSFLVLPMAARARREGGIAIRSKACSGDFLLARQSERAEPLAGRHELRHNQQTDHHHDCSGVIDEPSPVSPAPLMLYDNRGTLKIRPGQGNVGDRSGCKQDNAFAVSMVPKGPFRPAENSDSCWRVKVWSPRAGTFN